LNFKILRFGYIIFTSKFQPASSHNISLQSGHCWLKYGDITIFKMAAVWLLWKIFSCLLATFVQIFLKGTRKPLVNVFKFQLIKFLSCTWNLLFTT